MLNQKDAMTHASPVDPEDTTARVGASGADGAPQVRRLPEAALATGFFCRWDPVSPTVNHTPPKVSTPECCNLLGRARKIVRRGCAQDDRRGGESGDGWGARPRRRGRRHPSSRARCPPSPHCLSLPRHGHPCRGAAPNSTIPRHEMSVGLAGDRGAGAAGGSKGGGQSGSIGPDRRPAPHSPPRFRRYARSGCRHD